MILTTVRCEICNNQFRFDPREQQFEHEILDSWLTVLHGKSLQAQDGLHFCSGECLQDWLNQRLTVNDLSLKQDIDHHPYPYCCPTHFPLGPRIPSITGGHE